MSLLDGLYRYKSIKKYSLTKTLNDRKLNRGRDYSNDLVRDYYLVTFNAMMF